ncbi:MAG: LuxR C-terminal-related transcriptional regulator [Bacteroidota bacterium]|jgi:regulator of cell morphogenesis and NO signaling
MKLLTPNMKMADVVHSNYLLMPVINRFGIPLGFGEKTVTAVCRKHRINVDFFLAIANAFSNENYFPEKKLQTFNVLMIVDYLQKTHVYYIETQVPLIEKLLNDLLRRRPSDAKNLKLIKKFFLDYKEELFNHLEREETTTFPYVNKVYRLFHTPNPSTREKRALSKYSMHVYEEEHADVDEKLYDLKNILIKYVRGDSMHEVYQEVIFELFRLEKDIQDHTRIENNILLPLVEEMEDVLFYPAEHSRRTAGKNALAEAEIKSSALTETHRSEPVKGIYQVPQGIPKPVKQKLEGLTSRELEVLQLVACGFLNKQIADKLSISLHTVISHRRNITRKLQIKTVAGLTIYALLNGLISSKNIS